MADGRQLRLMRSRYTRQNRNVATYDDVKDAVTFFAFITNEHERVIATWDAHKVAWGYSATVLFRRSEAQ